jgi:hypothetical protein
MIDLAALLGIIEKEFGYLGRAAQEVRSKFHVSRRCTGPLFDKCSHAHILSKYPNTSHGCTEAIQTIAKQSHL